MNHLEDGSGLKNVWASSNFSCVKVKQLFFLRKISFLFLTFLWQVFDILILFANLHSGILCRGFSSPQRTRIYPSPLNVGIAIILKVHSGLKSQVFFFAPRSNMSSASQLSYRTGGQTKYSIEVAARLKIVGDILQ